MKVLTKKRAYNCRACVFKREGRCLLEALNDSYQELHILNPIKHEKLLKCYKQGFIYVLKEL